MGSRRASAHSVKDVNGEDILVPTPSRFEKLYLAPEQAVAGQLRQTFGNPTPVALGGFLLANTPANLDFAARLLLCEAAMSPWSDSASRLLMSDQTSLKRA